MPKILGKTKTVKALGLHHSAYRCRDAEETRSFWEDKIGFPLKMSLQIDEHPTTGEDIRYMHIFFDIGSHSEEQSNFLVHVFVLCQQHHQQPIVLRKVWIFLNL